MDGTEQLRVDADPAWSQPVGGVIGGLGPAATALYLRLVAELTPATRDQDHLDLVVLDHASTPDRTAAILDPTAADPGPSLARDARRLEALGAAFIAVPCNTAHHFLAAVRQQVGVPLISIVEETARAATLVAAEHAGSSTPRVAPLATDGTRASGVYQRVLDGLGTRTVLPGEAEQRLVMSVVYDGVKAGGPVDAAGLLAVIDRLLADGAHAVVLGCTELSVVYDRQGWRGHRQIVDSVTSLAAATVRRAGRTPRC